jgi:predicted PurR-regulated permease PerM
MTQTEERLLAYRRTVAVIAVVVFMVLAFLIVRPFLVAIIGAAVLAYLFYPLYKYMVDHFPKVLPRETLAAVITCVLIILIVLIPMGSITGLLATEARNGYLYFQKVLKEGGLVFDLPPIITERIGDVSPFTDTIISCGRQIAGWLQGVLTVIPNVVLNLLITIFSVYFFLKGGDRIYEFFREFFPLPTGRYKQILGRLDDLSRGMIMGQIVVGIIHGFLAWFAYSMLGVPSPVLWAFLTAIISIIPVLGAGLIWFPIAVYLFVSGYAVGTYWKGIVLLIYGLLLMTTIDNVLKPKIIGDRSRIHPLIILFGILGGIQLIGLPGIIIGPLVLGLFDVVMGIFREVI